VRQGGLPYLNPCAEATAQRQKCNPAFAEPVNTRSNAHNTNNAAHQCPSTHPSAQPHHRPCAHARITPPPQQQHVTQAPVQLPVPDKLVFSPHVYGPDVHGQPYFSHKQFPANMPEIWARHFGFVKQDRCVSHGLVRGVEGAGGVGWVLGSVAAILVVAVLLLVRCSFKAIKTPHPSDHEHGPTAQHN